MNKILPLMLAVLVSCTSPGNPPGSKGGETDTSAHTAVTGGTAKISYHLAIKNPADSDVEVSILVKDHNDSNLEFVMPTWAPFRLLRDDYAAFISEVKARGRGGKTLRMARVGANRWRVTASGQDLVFSYRVHASALSQGHSLVNDQGGILNAASVCMFVDGHRAQPIEINVGITESVKWSTYSALSASGGPGRFEAASYGELIRTPILVGRFSEHRIPHGTGVARVIVSPQGTSASEQIARGIEELLKQSTRYFGAAKHQDDLLFAFAFGLGSENRMANPGPRGLCIGTVEPLNTKSAQIALRTAANLMPRMRIDQALQTVSWNAVDFDRLLVDSVGWLPEALGRYFGGHLAQRAGLSNQSQLRSNLAEIINKVEIEPSKFDVTLQTVSENLALRRVAGQGFAPTNQGSQFFDAVERGIAVLLLLDLSLIGESGGTHDLGELLGVLEKNRGYMTTTAFLDACEQVGGHKLLTLADRLVTEKIVRPYSAVSRSAGFVIEAGSAERSQLGAKIEGRRVMSVVRGKAASRAGLQVGDRIVRFAGKNVGGTFGEKVASMPAGMSTTITVKRRGSLVTLPIQMGTIRRTGFAFDETNSGGEKTRNRFYGKLNTP